MLQYTITQATLKTINAVTELGLEMGVQPTLKAINSKLTPPGYHLFYANDWLLVLPKRIRTYDLPSVTMQLYDRLHPNVLSCYFTVRHLTEDIAVFYANDFIKYLNQFDDTQPIDTCLKPITFVKPTGGRV